MNKYYFTYGSSGMDFKGGWTVVEAPNYRSATTIFRVYHPDVNDGLLNCCSVYTEDDFVKTSMFKEGNFGKFAHEVIVVRRVFL